MGQASNGCVLQVGWLSNYRLNPKNHAPQKLQALSLIRELFHETFTNTLRAVPPVELVLLRNGSIGSAHAMLMPGEL